MATLSQRAVEGITSALEASGANLPCHRCGHDDFAVVNQYLQIIVEPELSPDRSLADGLNTMPLIGAACTQCGWLSLHSVQVLGLHGRG